MFEKKVFPNIFEENPNPFPSPAETIIKSIVNSGEQKPQSQNRNESKTGRLASGYRLESATNQGEMNQDDSNIYDEMEKDILNADIPDTEKQKLLTNVLKLKGTKVNIMITGATGSGKSSTINAMFNTEVAKVGIGVDPETMTITKYNLGNLILWDSPGLGDGKEADNIHAKNIINKLSELDEDGKALIDLVLVIVDGGSKDLGTSYELINQVIIPNMGDDKEKRILVAINQCDMGLKGRHWNHDKNEPEPPLVQFLEDKVWSVKRRIQEGTSVNITPIYYSAGFKETGVEQRPYNLSKLLYFIVTHTPSQKRLAFVDNINKDDAMWQDNDDLKDYNNEIRKSFTETVIDYASKGAEIGGKYFGTPGRIVGGVIGGVVGGFKSLFGG